MKFENIQLADMCERDRRNAQKYQTLVGIWAVTFVVAIVVLGPGPEDAASTPIWMWVLALTPIFIGIFVVSAYTHFLAEADELIKKVHIEALAMGCGAAIILGTGFGLVAQVLGPWEDSGSLTWASTLLAFSIGYHRASKRYSV